MSMAFPETEERTSIGDGDDGIFHLWCCDENTAICGKDITDLPIGKQPGDAHCVVCEDPEVFCPICHQNGYGELEP